MTHWPRGVEAAHPELGRFALGELPEELLTEQEDAGFDRQRRQRLARLDRRYAGWLPGL